MENYKRSKLEYLNDFISSIMFLVLKNFPRLFIYYYQKFFLGKHKQLLKNIELKKLVETKECFILGNGPSLNNQKIELLKDKTVFMVNRSFLDERYSVIKPRFHIIVDNKLSTGEWPISYLDDIAKKNPEVIFLLNSKWYDLEVFQEYKKKYKIYWIDQSLELTKFNLKSKIDITKRTYGKYVVEQGIVVATYMGFKKIYITGVDGDGFANLLLNQQSHSYGTNTDDIEKFKSWVGVRQSICSVCQWMLSWYYLNQYIINNNSKIVNLTGRGIISMVELDKFENIVKEI